MKTAEWTLRLTYSDSIAGADLKGVGSSWQQGSDEAFSFETREDDPRTAVGIDHVHFVLSYH